ncbi:hypothetical protein [Nannocystis pusilla]|uniref:hypothetical protein n=1 Tax=Nannocystis pusilla TaxID=889268 RepID=UPI003B7C2EB4
MSSAGSYSLNQSSCHFFNCGMSSYGTPTSAAITRIGSLNVKSRISSSSSGPRASSAANSSANLRICGSIAATLAGVNAFENNSRARVCDGGSLLNSPGGSGKRPFCSRASSSGVNGTTGSSRRADENSPGSRSTCITSAWLVTR